MGYIMSAAVLISYIGCIPFFILNAHEYARNIKYQRIITNYVTSNSKSKLLLWLTYINEQLIRLWKY